MSTRLTYLSPMLYTRELKATIDFYKNILGFTCDEFNEDWGWANLHRDEVQIMICLPNPHLAFDKPTFTGSFYISVDDVDAEWEKLKDKTKVCYPIEDFEYGMREFAVYDNNGYLLQFGKEI